MRPLLWLSPLLLLLIGCAGPKKTAGVDDAAAPIGASQIVVSYAGSPTEAYRATAQALQDAGFALAQSDATLRSLTTAPKSSSDTFGPVRDMVVSAQVRSESGVKVVLQGTFEDGYTIEKKGQSGSPARKAWARLHRLASRVGEPTKYR